MTDHVWAALGEATPFASGCASRTVLDHVTSKWGVLVVVALAQKSMRWGELHRYIEGISEKMLAQTLRILEADGFVLRESAGTVPPRVDYTLTTLGKELADVLIPLVRWTTENAGRTGVIAQESDARNPG